MKVTEDLDLKSPEPEQPSTRSPPLRAVQDSPRAARRAEVDYSKDRG